MVSSREKYTFIDAGTQDKSRPAERSPKSNWKIEMIKKSVGIIQHLSPRMAAGFVWHYFTKPGKSRFTKAQQELIDQAEISKISYFGHEIVTYRWGDSGPKVLLSHGWNSKIADFRRMINQLVDAGYVVEGIDMKAHGKSSGKHTALPEIIDILKSFYVKNGPYHSVIGYSIGGLAVGMMLSELSTDFQPSKLFMIASPSHSRYIFKDVIDSLNYSEQVYEEMCEKVEQQYHQAIDYFDLRNKTKHIQIPEMHLIYDQDDETVGIERGKELLDSFSDAHFVETKGLGHYKVIAYQDVINYICDNMPS